MNVIKNYLETMFAHLPATLEVLKAKEELLQMMEDKYNELLAEGRSENEAVGCVISEFGNLDELAAELGIEQETKTAEDDRMQSPRREVSLNEVGAYLEMKTKSALLVSSGVFLCVISVIGPILSDSFHLNDAVGITAMMLMIACAVALFIYNGSSMDEWKFIKAQPCHIDYMTTQYVEDEKNRRKSQLNLNMTIGILLCIVCWLPIMIISELHIVSRVMEMENIGAVILFILVGIGVYMIVNTAIEKDGYNTLLNLNESGTVSGGYVSKKNQIHYDDPALETFMSLYWLIITAGYLCWSFLTFKWWISWVIWPVAGVVHGIIEKSFGHKDR